MVVVVMMGVVMVGVVVVVTDGSPINKTNDLTQLYKIDTEYMHRKVKVIDVIKL